MGYNTVKVTDIGKKIVESNVTFKVGKIVS